MKSLKMSALVLAAAVGFTGYANATDLTIAIVNNGHMINMQKVAKHTLLKQELT